MAENKNTDLDLKREAALADREVELLNEYNLYLSEHRKYHKLSTVFYVLNVVFILLVLGQLGAIAFFDLAKTPGIMLCVACALSSLGLITIVYFGRRFDKLAWKNYSSAIDRDLELRDVMADTGELKCHICGAANTLLIMRSDTGRLVCANCERTLKQAELANNK